MADAVSWLARSVWLTVAAVLALGIVAIAIATRFGLTITGGFGLYFVVWWVVLFAILPIRIRSQAEDGTVVDGTDPGAPADPALKERAIWTSVATTLLYVAITGLAPLQGL